MAHTSSLASSRVDHQSYQGCSGIHKILRRTNFGQSLTRAIPQNLRTQSSSAVSSRHIEASHCFHSLGSNQTGGYLLCRKYNASWCWCLETLCPFSCFDTDPFGGAALRIHHVKADLVHQKTRALACYRATHNPIVQLLTREQYGDYVIRFGINISPISP